MGDVNRTRLDFLRRRRVWLVTGALVAVGGLLIGSGLVVSKAEAGWGRRGWGHHGDGSFDLGRAKEHVAYAVGFALHRVDASDDQEEQILAIVNRSIDEIAQGAAEHRSRRGELKRLFEQPNVDREALEAIRKAELQLADDMSQRIVSAIADVAEVLSIEQRAELMEMHQGTRRWH